MNHSILWTGKHASQAKPSWWKHRRKHRLALSWAAACCSAFVQHATKLRTVYYPTVQLAVQGKNNEQRTMRLRLCSAIGTCINIFLLHGCWPYDQLKCCRLSFTPFVWPMTLTNYSYQSGGQQKTEKCRILQFVLVFFWHGKCCHCAQVALDSQATAAAADSLPGWVTSLLQYIWGHVW